MQATESPGGGVASGVGEVAGVTVRTGVGQGRGAEAPPTGEPVPPVAPLAPAGPVAGLRVEFTTFVACDTRLWRSGPSFHSVLPSNRVSMFPANATTMPMMSMIRFALRLYQPDTRSMVSSNQPSML